MNTNNKYTKFKILILSLIALIIVTAVLAVMNDVSSESPFWLLLEEWFDKIIQIL